MSSHEATPATLSDDVRDELPADLDAMSALSDYQFPDNSRRRIPGIIYLVLAAVCAIAYFTMPGSVLVNGGIGWAAVMLGVVGVISLTSGWRMTVDEKDALVAAQLVLDFPVGHASAQQVWHGWRSRPTWRVLVYSPEEPPLKRGLALIDAVDGTVIEHLTEANPERWAATGDTATTEFDEFAEFDEFDEFAEFDDFDPAFDDDFEAGQHRSGGYKSRDEYDLGDPNHTPDAREGA